MQQQTWILVESRFVQAKEIHAMQAVTITKLPLAMSNAYLVRGERTILVDSGTAKDVPKIRQALAAAGLTASDLALLVHTHGHGGPLAARDVKEWMDRMVGWDIRRLRQAQPAYVPPHHLTRS